MIRTILAICLALLLAAGTAACGLVTAVFTGNEEEICSGTERIGKRVVETYQSIEDSVVGEYKSIEDAFADAYLE